MNIYEYCINNNIVTISKYKQNTQEMLCFSDFEIFFNMNDIKLNNWKSSE